MKVHKRTYIFKIQNNRVCINIPLQHERIKTLIYDIYTEKLFLNHIN